jgi:SPP1 gp7 family putative phage head morphogenesis protein
LSFSNTAFLNNTNDPTATMNLVIYTENKIILVLDKHHKEMIKLFKESIGDTQKTEKLIGFSQQAILDIREIDNELNQIENRLSSDIMGIISNSIDQAYRRGVNHATAQINRIQTHPTIPRLSKKDQQTIQLLKNTSFDLVKTLSAQDVSKAKTVFINGLANGWSQKEIIDSIVSVTNSTEPQIRRIVRTELTRTSNVGAKKRYLSSGLKYVQWNTAIDERVCPICGQLHGKVIEFGESFTVYLTGTGQKQNKGKNITMPPAHPNCRCGLSPAFRKIKKPVTKLPKIDKVKVKTLGLSRKERKSLKEDIKIIPNQIRAKISSLNGSSIIYKSKEDVLVDDKIVQDVIPQVVINNYREATSLYVGSGINQIFIGKNSTRDETLHEIGHAVYNEYLKTNGHYINSLETIHENYVLEDRLPTLRCYNDSDEFFADMFRFYYTKNDWLNREYPEAYTFLKEKIFYGNTDEVRVSNEK